MTQGKIRSLILTVMGILLAGFWLYAVFGGGMEPAKTALELGGDVRAQIQAELAAEDNAVRKFVEYAHRTVTVKSLELLKCEVTTIDGTDAVNADLSNIRKIEVVILAVWDGWFAKNGRSEVHYSLIPQDGKLHPTPFRIPERSTTARYTRSDCR